MAATKFVKAKSVAGTFKIIHAIACKRPHLLRNGKRRCY